jgi:hypothetical protein
MSSSDFEIKVEPGPGGGFNVTIKQVTGVHLYDPMMGGYYIEPVVLTPYEAEKLADEIRDAIKAARANMQKTKYNIP